LFFSKEVVWFHKIAASSVIALFVIINLLGAFLTGKAEDIMVFIKVFILLVFVGVGIFSADFHRLSPEYWESSIKIITGGLIIFLAYEGFELIANTAKDIENPQKNLPRAFFASVIFVIFLYVSIAIVTVGNVSFAEAKKAQDYVLAIATKPFFGEAGFIIISIAALLSTASAINATLYGGGRVGYLVAKLGELPSNFAKKVKEGYEGMIILGLLAIIFATSFDIQNISIAGSLGFLIIFGLVNLANFKLRNETNSNFLLPLVGFILCISAAVILVGYNAKNSPESLKSSLLVIVIVVVFSVIYNKLGKEMKTVLDEDLRREING
jgi:amino acid transporter